MPVTLEQIKQAAQTIRDEIIRTPLILSPTLSHMFGGNIFLKMENLQHTGAFKIRGATYKLKRCMAHIGAGGVVAVSAGNHAQGVALAAKRANIPATIIMPEWASISKQEATRGYAGEVVIFGQSIEESLVKAKELVKEGKTFIHPFDDPDIIAGQGTIGLEIFDDLPEVDTIVVPVGGGGLISGIARAAKSINPNVKIIGVQAASCPSVYQSKMQNKIVAVTSSHSIADGINVKQVGEETFKIIKKDVDEIVLAKESEIVTAMLLLLERKKILAEGSGAIPVAALLNGSIEVPSDGRTVLVISGGNVDSPVLGRIIRKGLLKNGRIMRIRVRLDDIPGALARLLSRVAKSKANVLHIYHDRYVRENPIDVTHVELELETRGASHVEQVAGELQKAGYEMSLK
ncbi:MAG TPA: threonine ammonia-lyase [Deltaproteobacteria bacterium]|nr:threonine ammonia-lyase [Deltaproteobacteria bacterium]